MNRLGRALFGLGLLLAAPELNASPDGSRPRPEPVAPKVVRELEGLRTPVARHYLLEDGRIRAEISGAPTGYRASDGRWSPLDPVFRPYRGAFEGEGSLLAVSAGDELVIGDRRDDSRVSASPLMLDGVPAGGTWTVLSKARLERAGAFTERLTLGGDRVVREVVLPAPKPGDAVISTRYTLPEGWGIRSAAGLAPEQAGPSYPVIVDASGRSRLHLLPPAGWEENCSGDETADCRTTGRMVPILDGRVLTITVTFPSSWLNAPGRRYPVLLDPSVSYSGNYGGYIYDNSTAGWSLFEANPTNLVRLTGNRLSSGPTAGYIKFDITSVPPTARVTDSSINAYLYSSTSAAWIYAYDAADEAPYGALSQATWGTIYADLRGGELYSLWNAPNGGSGLLGVSGGSVLDRDVQSRLPDGYLVAGFVSDGTGSTDSSERRLDSAATILSITYDAAHPSGLCITEVNLGSPDWVEIYNYGADFTLTGYKLNTFDGTVKSYTFPVFALKRHSFVRIIEGAGTDTATDLYTGVSWAWNPGDDAEVGLATGSSVGIDYVKLGAPADSTVDDSQKWNGPGLAGSSNIVRRVHDDDTDQALDWTVGGTATPGGFNAGLVGSRRRSPIVLNEVSTSPDAVEILNLAEVPVALDGWGLATYTNDTLDGSGFTVPAGVTVPPGGLLRISESTGTNSLSEVFCGYNIGWTTSTTGEVLFDQNANTLGLGDVLFFNDPQDNHLFGSLQFNGTAPAPASSTQYARVDHSDADSAFDWGGTSTDSLGYPNPGQTDPLRTKSWEIGTASSTFTTTNYAYGNRFTATQSGVIVSFKQEVIVNASQNVTLYVLENAGGGFSTIFSRAFPSLAPGGYVLSTGLVKLPMVSGRNYAFLLYGTGSLTFPRESDSPCLEYAGFGTWDGYAYSNGAPGALTNGGTTTALHQWIEVIPGAATLPALVISTTSLPKGTNGAPYSVQLAAEGGSGGYTWNLQSGALPAGLTLSPRGLLSGTPTGTGTSSFTVRVTDAFGNTATRSFSVVIVGPAAVQWVTSWLPDGVVSQAYPQVVLAAEGGTAPYTFTLFSGSLPAGLSLSAGKLVGTPTGAGSSTFTLRVSDSAAHTANRSFTVSIEAAGLKPYWVRRGLNGGELGFLAVSPNWATDQTAFTTKKQGSKLFVTHDRGRSWATLDLGLSLAQGTWRALTLSPTFDANGSNGSGKTVFGLYHVGSSTYVVRSTNGGSTWTSALLPMPADFMTLSPNYGSDGTLLAWSQFGGRLMKSVNSGVSWSTLAQDVDSARMLVDGTILALGIPDGAEYSPLLASADGGASFAQRGRVFRVRNLEVSPSYATDRTLFAYWDTLQRSADGGFTWEDVTNGIPGGLTPVRSLSMQPTFDSTQATRRNVFITSGAPKSDILLYRSVDAGSAFTRVSTALPDEGGDIGYIGGGGWAPMDIVNPPVHVSPNWETDGMLFDVDRGFWISGDSGLTWEQRSDGITALHFTVIAYSPAYATDRTIFAATADGGLYKSANGGATMTRLRIPHATDPTRLELDIRSVAIPSTYNDLTGTNGDTSGETKTVFVCGEGGAYRTRDGGLTWTAATLPAANAEEKFNLEEIRTSPSYLTRKTVIVANEWHLWRSTDGGNTFVDFVRPYAWPNKFYVNDLEFSPNYNTDNTVFFSGWIGGDEAWRSANFNGASPTWSRLNCPASGSDWDVQLGNGYLNGSVTPRRRIFWVGNQKTIDNGTSWSTVDPGKLSSLFYTDDTLLRTTANPVNVRRSVDGGATDALLSADPDLGAYPLQAGPFIGPSYSPTTGTVLYAMDGVLLYSSDGGATYSPVDGRQSISNDIRGIDTDKNDSNVVYVATGDQGLFKSLDRGVTFHRLQKGLPTGSPTWESIRVLGAGQTTVIAGHSTLGIYRSIDSGLSWVQVAGTAGRVRNFIEGGGYVFASRSDGRSFRSSDSGATWTLLDATRPDLAAISYRGSVISTVANRKEGRGTDAAPGDPSGIAGLVWGVSWTAGPAASMTSGTSFTVMDGAGGPFPIPLDQPWLSVLAWSGSDDDVLAGSQGNGVWKTTDGGDTWHRMTRGLEATSGIVAELFEAPNGDILAGITGTSDGGVYLSGDGGRHWMVLNEGFDPNDTSVQDLVNDSASDGTLSYWAGKSDDGIWTRTIEILPDPTVTSLSLTTGPAAGGTALVVTGLDFQPGAVVEFDGIPAPTVFVNSTTLNVTTVPHWAGAAVVTVVNPDTRDGLSPQAFTFTAGAGALVLTLTKSGASDVALSWVDPPPANASYDVYWSTDPTFDGWVEPAATGLLTTTWTHAGVAGNGFVYYYDVE